MFPMLGVKSIKTATVLFCEVHVTYNGNICFFLLTYQVPSVNITMVDKMKKDKAPKLMILLLCTVINSHKVEAKINVSPGIETPKDVIVVGGGLAGMAAARKLTNAPEKYAVKVLEARKDRYGGRVFTDRQQYGVRGKD